MTDNEAKEPITHFGFLGPINTDTVPHICRALNSALNAQCKQIHLNLSSAGGDVDSGIYLFNHIRSLPTHLTIHCMAKVSSIAVLVAVAAKVRTCSAASTFLIHPTTFGPSNEVMSATVLKDRLNSIIDIECYTNALMKSRTSLTDELLEAQLFGDVSLTAKDALRYGIVHEIKEFSLPPDKEIIQI